MKNLITPIEQEWDIWKECLHGNDKNTLWFQMINLIRDEGIFKLMLESRQSTIDQNPLKPPINNHLHNFIDRVYSQSLFISVRRIIGSEKIDALVGSKGVYSFYSLIKDIENYQSDLTREKYFNLRNIPYEIEEMQKKEDSFIRTQISTNVNGFFIPHEYSVTPTLDAHQIFDEVSGKGEKNRSRHDLISNDYFQKIRYNLKKAQKIIDFTDKNIAHSATPESRATVKISPLSLKETWDVCIVLVKVLNALGSFISSTVFMVLPIEPTDFFDNWDSPLIPKGNETKLKEVYRDFRSETEQWMSETQL